MPKEILGSSYTLAYEPSMQLLIIYIQTNLQATVDHQCCFTSHELGWPGSVPDMKVWKQSHIWMHHQDYFKNGEYILVDKGRLYYLLQNALLTSTRLSIISICDVTI